MTPEVCVFDIEADGLKPTRIHVLSANISGTVRSTDSYDNMRKFLQRGHVLVGHNIMLWDIPNVERLLGISCVGKVVDTLALSWYLCPDVDRHGLEEWGEFFGIPKPPISDWENLSYEEYKHRCEQDVRINTMLWEYLWGKLIRLYDDNEEEAWRLIDYLMFKLDCVREQERSRWKLDVPACEELAAKLSAERNERVSALAKAMPINKKWARRMPPKRFYKATGVIGELGNRWIALCRENGLSDDYRGHIDVVVGEEEGNPGSHEQIKAWLFSLGWKPEHYKYIREEGTRNYRKIPQVANKDKDEGGLCPSVLKLAEKEPAIELFAGVSILNHRLSILNGFLQNQEDGFLKARVGGLTNTLRFKHRELVNLPGIDKPYGKEIRGLLVAEDGYELCGSDMSSLEDRTKQHYMWPFDPAYVIEMQKPGFDPHLDLAVFAGALTYDEAELSKVDKAVKKKLSPVRKAYKCANYAAVYGASGPVVARTADLPEEEGYKLVDAYWKRNWSVKEIPKGISVKRNEDGMWMYNPVSRLWYSLREEKDIFSTLNQGTGVWAFDTWIKHVRSRRPQLTGQFHDEIILQVKKGNREKCEELLRWAIDETNKELSLNRELDIDIQFGDNYAAIH